MFTSLLLTSRIFCIGGYQSRSSISLNGLPEINKISVRFFQAEKISFGKDEYIKRCIKPFSSFKENPTIRRICHNNEKEIAEAYEKYYTTRYNQLKDEYDKTGNPATMI